MHSKNKITVANKSTEEKAAPAPSLRKFHFRPSRSNIIAVKDNGFAHGP